MQKFLGIVCVVGGVLLLVWGQNVSSSLGSQIHQTLTGSPPDKATYLYLGGAVLEVIGISLIFIGKK
jgi:hypothetical protein